MRPIAITPYAQECWDALEKITDVKEKTKAAYQQLRKSGEPEVSIVIPAYNEEKNIVQTLYSLCNNITSKSVEIIVVNNNSKDNTASLVEACGVTCVLETKQGITNARNGGLAHATGKYVLNADADSIYPKQWVEEMVKPFDKYPNVCSVYGRFSFIPVGNTGRFTYFFYEYIADFMRWLNKYIKDEAVNVYGFNSGFRREQGLQVDGFNHPPGTNEDGWLALKLREKGFGKLYYVTNINALVWTTDRRIQIDGGIVKGTIRRIKRMFFKGER